MSVQAITWALGAPTDNPAAQCLLLVLANYADERGECWPSQERLASETKMSVRSVRRKLAELAAAKLIAREHRGAPYDAGGRATDYYRLSMDLPEKASGSELSGQLGRKGDLPARSSRTYRPTVAAIDEPPKEHSQEALASCAPNDRELKTLLVWEDCPRKLIDLGLEDSRARKLVGRWLKVADPDRLHELIDAAHRNGTEDPIAYVTAGLAKQRRPWKREGPKVYVWGTSELAERWRAYGRRTDQGALAYLGSTGIPGRYVDDWVLLPNGIDRVTPEPQRSPAVPMPRGDLGGALARAPAP